MLLRFLMPPLTIIVLLTLLTQLWLPGYVHSFLSQEVARRGQLAAEALDKSALGFLAVHDLSALEQLAKGLIRSEDIHYVLILDDQGQILGDSGISDEDYRGIKDLLGKILESEADQLQPGYRASSGEPVFHIARPVFYDQLRVGTIFLAIASGRIALMVSHLRRQMGLVSLLALFLAILLSYVQARKVSKPIRALANGMEDLTDEQLEALAGDVRELNLLTERVQRMRNLFTHSLDEMEGQKLQLESQLASIQEKSSTLNSKLRTTTKQVSTLQERFLQQPNRPDSLASLEPLIQFANGMAPEMQRLMQSMIESAEALQRDLHRLRQDRLPARQTTLSQAEKEKPWPDGEDTDYDGILDAVDQLVATIRGGANWTEQFTDLIRQITLRQIPKGK